MGTMRYLIAVLTFLSCGPGPELPAGPCVENYVVCDQEARTLTVCYHGEWFLAYTTPCDESLTAETAVNACFIPTNQCPTWEPVDHGS